MQTSPLDGLHDVIAPNHVDWWPLAPLWWVIIAVILVCILAIGYTFYQRHKFSKAKQHAITLSQQLDDDTQQLHILIKRLVLHYYNQPLASSNTKHWCKILKRLCDVDFSEQELLSLYQPNHNQSELADKLRLAIKQFKLKEPLNV